MANQTTLEGEALDLAGIYEMLDRLQSAAFNGRLDTDLKIAKKGAAIFSNSLGLAAGNIQHNDFYLYQVDGHNKLLYRETITATEAQEQQQRMVDFDLDATDHWFVDLLFDRIPVKETT